MIVTVAVRTRHGLILFDFKWFDLNLNVIVLVVVVRALLIRVLFEFEIVHLRLDIGVTQEVVLAVNLC